MNTTRLRVVLRDVYMTDTQVRELQAAIGWTDSHLHHFVTPQATYGMEIPGGVARGPA